MSGQGIHLTDERAGELNDIRDPRFDYPRTTPEKRLAARMGVHRQWDDWQDQRASYQADPDVRDNAASWLRL